MNLFKCKKNIAALLLVCMALTSCSPSQKVIDNILPNYKERMYSVADLIPYNYKELRNAQALYGVELFDYFIDKLTYEEIVALFGEDAKNYYTKKASSGSEAKMKTEEERNAFYSELRCRTANYKLLRERIAMYIEDERQTSATKEAERKKEYDQYYKIPTAAGGNVIKKYNNGKLQGMPLMSIRVDMSTATMSEVDDLYSEATCDIFRPVVIEESKYKKLKFGDEIVLDVPATASSLIGDSTRTAFTTDTKKVTCKYIATDSLAYVNDEGKTDYYFIANVDGTNTQCRRVLDYYGKTLEVFVERRPLQFMKYARVARANEPQRLMEEIVQGNLNAYDYDKIAVRALSGGYLVYEYKDYIYANSVTTNLKGYITALYNYDNQRIDNKFYNSLD